MPSIKRVLAIVFMGLVCVAPSAFALPFSIVANGTLPTSIQPGSTAAASYTITNTTNFSPPSNSIKFLPPNVTINTSTSTCLPSNGFVLAARQSCQLNLIVSGAVNGNDPNLNNHLLVCMSDTITCAGPNPANSLNVTVATQSNPVLYGVGGVGPGYIPASSKLYSINTSTAATTLVMALSNNTRSAIVSDGNSLYHLGAALVLTSGDIFERINLSSLTTSQISLSGSLFEAPFGAVFYHSDNAFLVTNGNTGLNTVNTNGVSTSIGSTGTSLVAGLACYNHAIYGVSPSITFGYLTGPGLIKIDPTTGATLSTVLITLSGYTVQTTQGLTVNPNTGVFYILLTAVSSDLSKSLGVASQQLATINVNTGVATLIGTISGVALTSIAFNPADANC